MKQERMENVDIERCKEVFAYEMTEVILALKGEFATVSGKELGYEPYQLSEEQRTELQTAAQQRIAPIQPQLPCIPEEVASDLAAWQGREPWVSAAELQAEHEVKKVHIALPDMRLPTVAAPAQPPKAVALPAVQMPQCITLPRADIKAADVPAEQKAISIPVVPHIATGVPADDKTDTDLAESQRRLLACAASMKRVPISVPDATEVRLDRGLQITVPKRVEFAIHRADVAKHRPPESADIPSGEDLRSALRGLSEAIVF